MLRAAPKKSPFAHGLIAAANVIFSGCGLPPQGGQVEYVKKTSNSADAHAQNCTTPQTSDHPHLTESKTFALLHEEDHPPATPEPPASQNSSAPARPNPPVHPTVPSGNSTTQYPDDCSNQNHSQS